MYNWNRIPARTRPWKPAVRPYLLGAAAYLAWTALVIYGLTTI